MTRFIRKYTMLFLFGAVVGFALAAWFAPTVLAWYSEPPIVNSSCNYAELTRWAARKLLWSQLIAAGSMGIFMIGLGAIFRGRKPAKPSTVPAGQPLPQDPGLKLPPR